MKFDIYSHKFKIFANLIFFIYLTFVLRLAVFRDNFDISRIFEIGKYNLNLFIDYKNVWQNGGFKTFFKLFFGNLGWFLPFGMFLRYKFINLQIYKILFFGFLFSLCIEISQFVFKTGIFELDDLILNIIGVFLGIKFCEFLIKIFAK